MTEQTHTKKPEEGSALTAPVVMGTFFFVLLLFSAFQTLKYTTISVLVLTIFSAYAKKDKLLGRISLPVLPVVVMVGLSGLSVFYALAKKFALYEFLSLLLAFCVFVLCLAFVDKIQSVAGAVAVCGSLLTFFSIDLISTRFFYGILELFIGSVAKQYSDLVGIEVGVRMLSIIENPNVYSGCAGVAVLMSLGLYMNSVKKQEKRFYLACLMLNSLGFVLAFSMGATATILLGFLTFLLVEEKENRSKLFILMVQTLFFAVISAFPIFYTSFELWDGVNFVPLLCLAFSIVGLIFAQEKLSAPISAFFQKNNKKEQALFGSVVAFLLAYCLISANFTTSYQFVSNEGLRRAVYPDSGTYTVSSTASDEVTVKVYSQNIEQTMMFTNTRLYSGALSEANFTVPEDSLVVYFDFSAPEGTKLETVALSDGTKVPLEYPLLPGFVSNRLQGLWANQNAIQRTVFFQDGMKLFARSPIFGLGMGSFENAIFQVQSFFYETKYVHNHYIQQLLDVGILGFLSFVSVFFGGIWGLKRCKKAKTPVPLLACSCSVLIFIFSHAFVEVVWSMSYYLIFAFGSLAVVALQLEESTKEMKSPFSKPLAFYLSLGCGTVFAVLLCGNIYSQSLMKDITEENFVATMLKASKMDVFENQDYKTSYVNFAITSDDPEIHAQSEQFIEDLQKINSNTIPYYIGLYYLSRNDVEKATDSFVTYVTYVSSNSEHWDTAFYELMMALNLENYGEIITALETLHTLKEQWNAENMGEIKLNTQIQSELNRLLNLEG